MKKYTILGHIFELDPRAHDFLASYITRIESYANANNISTDILDDIKYNIIEKLYQSETPVNESYIMNLANIIGEPEQIFDTKSDSDEVPSTNKNFLERRLGKQKPMIWGVSYWIAKSFNIPVSLVRLLFLVAVFIYGTSIWLYPLLALFVPFHDKKSSSGSVGNAFFEIIRAIIWLGLFLLLGSAVIGFIVALTFGLSIPLLSNQSIQSLVPSYLYPVAAVTLISLIVLWIGSLGAMIKKSRISKTWAMIAIMLIILSGVIAGITSYSKAVQYNYNELTQTRDTIQTFTTDSNELIITLNGDKVIKNNYFGHGFGAIFTEDEIFQEIELLASTGDTIQVEVHDTFNILDHNQDTILSKRSTVQATHSGNELIINIPNNIFSQKVPFVFAEREIKIYIPTNKTIQYNNNSNVRYGTPSVRHDWTQGDEKRIYCEDKTSFKYYETYKDWRCANTTFSLVNQDNDRDYDRDVEYNDLGDRIEDAIEQPLDRIEDNIESRVDAVEDRISSIIDITKLTQDQEDLLEQTFRGLTIMQAQDLAGNKGYSLRVVEQDGVDLPRTEDLRPGRINVDINNGVITDVDIE